MSTARKNLLVTSIIVIIILIATIVLWKKENKQSVATGENQVASTTTVEIPGGGTVIVGKGAVVKEVDTTLSTPDFVKPLTFSSSTSVDVRAALNTQYAAVQGILKQKPTDFNAWLQLGIIRKIGGDYAGAAQDWNYVAALYPQSAVPHDDLGDLYLNFIKDQAKAESEYLQAVRLNPQDVNAFRTLFSLYTDYGYKAGTTAAENILKLAIKDNPNVVDFYVMLARYYVAQGNMIAAKTEYPIAITVAERTDNTSLVSTLQQELSDLR